MAAHCPRLDPALHTDLFGVLVVFDAIQSSRLCHPCRTALFHYLEGILNDIAPTLDRQVTSPDTQILGVLAIASERACHGVNSTGESTTPSLWISTALSTQYFPLHAYKHLRAHLDPQWWTALVQRILLLVPDASKAQADLWFALEGENFDSLFRDTDEAVGGVRQRLEDFVARHRLRLTFFDANSDAEGCTCPGAELHGDLDAMAVEMVLGCVGEHVLRAVRETLDEETQGGWLPWHLRASVVVEEFKTLAKESWKRRERNLERLLDEIGIAGALVEFREKACHSKNESWSAIPLADRLHHGIVKAWLMEAPATARMTDRVKTDRNRAMLKQIQCAMSI